MLKISRYQIIQVHMLLAAFLLPLALMYFISGALYTLDIKGHIKKQKVILQLEQPFSPNLDVLTQVAKRGLIHKGFPLPSGEPMLKKKKGVYELRWSDLKYAVKLHSTRDPMVAKLTVKKRSFLTQIMRIHRAEAGSVFRFFTLLLVSGLLIIFISGIYMALKIPKFRKPTFLAMGLGLITFAALIFT